MIRHTGKPRPPAGGAARLAPRHGLADRYVALLHQIRNSQNGAAGTSPAVGVTACTPNAGVSTIAANLAIVASRTGRRPVLLLDANVANPAVAAAFDIGPAPGVADVLLGEAGVDECIQASGDENLFLLGAGLTNGAENPFVDPQAMGEMLDTLKSRFALIVLDLPRVGEVTSCSALASKLDGVLLVIEANRVSAELASRAKRSLLQADARVLGVVFNKGGNAC